MHTKILLTLAIWITSVNTLALEFAAGFESDYPLLEPPVVHQLHLRMTELDAQVLFRKEPQDRSSFPMSVVQDGRMLSGRVKVKGSFTRNFLKKSLVIELADETWQGNKKFALNAMATDPSSLREWLAWDLIAALGMHAPQVDYLRLFINDRYIGLFLLFEWITDATFARQGLGTGGLLYHPNDDLFCGDLSLANMPRLQECWFNLSPPGSRQVGYAPLEMLAEALASTPVEAFDRYLTVHFNVDTVLDWLLVNTVVSNGDTYHKNYYLHQAAEHGRWSVIPWDYDLSFGRSADPVLPFPRNILNDNFNYLGAPDLGMPHALKDKTLRNPQLMESFRSRMGHLLGAARDEGMSEAAFGWFSPPRFLGRIEQLRRMIAGQPSLERYRNDPPDLAKTHTDALRWYGLMRYHYLRQLLIEPTPFGTARWMAGSSYPLLLDEYPQRVALSLMVNLDLPPGESWVVPSDAWLGRPLGLLHVTGLERPVRVRLEVDSERTPDLLPPGLSPEDCVRRSWFLDLKMGSALSMNIILDYQQQSSVRHELGGIDEAQGLHLWQLSGGKWRVLPSRFNPLANTLSADGVKLSAGEVSQLVACSSGQLSTGHIPLQR